MGDCSLVVTLTCHIPLRGHSLGGECRIMVALVYHRPLRGHLLWECRLVVTLVYQRPLRGSLQGDCGLVGTLACHRHLGGHVLGECWVKAHLSDSVLVHLTCTRKPWLNIHLQSDSSHPHSHTSSASPLSPHVW